MNRRKVLNVRKLIQAEAVSVASLVIPAFTLGEDELVVFSNGGDETPVLDFFR